MNAPIQTKTFKSGNSEAVRLPKGMGFGVGIDVTVERRGDELVVRAAANPAEEKAALRRLVAKLNAIGRITDRYEREPIDFPDRPGLY